MGTLVNGIKEIFSAQKTSATDVMTCTSNGTPDGHVSIDILKNLVGGLPYVGRAEDANNITSQGLYICHNTTTNVPNKMNVSTGFIFHIVIPNCWLQIAIPSGSSHIFIRTKWYTGAPSTWKQIATSDVSA